MPMRQRVLGVVGVLALAALAGWWFTRAPVAPAAVVGSGPLVRTLQFSGRVAAQSSVEVGATLTGRVASIVVREGDTVEAGSPLLRLEDDEARAALAQADASARQAEAALAGATGARRETAAATLAQAEAQRVAALAEQRRTADLVARGFLSPSRGDEAARALAVAQAQVDAARAQRDALATQGSERALAEAQGAAARAAVDAARARLAQTVVRSPAAARVLQRAVEPGQIVQPGKALLTLALDGPVELLAQVDERFLEELQAGQTAVVVADAFPTQRFEATLLRIAPRVDAQRGSVELRFALAHRPAFLREDMTLSIAVVTARRERALTMPLAALRPEDRAWVAEDGRVRARNLRLGLRSSDRIEVLDGLAEGDRVLLSDTPLPGARVRADEGRAASNGQATGEAGAAMTQAVGR
jgi:HlyD family secretion protein